MLTRTYRALHFCAVLEAVGVCIGETELALGMLNSLPSKSENISTTVCELVYDSRNFSLGTVISCLLQEE